MSPEPLKSPRFADLAPRTPIRLLQMLRIRYTLPLLLVAAAGQLCAQSQSPETTPPVKEQTLKEQWENLGLVYRDPKAKGLQELGEHVLLSALPRAHVRVPCGDGLGRRSPAEVSGESAPGGGRAGPWREVRVRGRARAARAASV